MNDSTYINVTDRFVTGLRQYIQQRGLALDDVVEVFAGNGKLGLQLGLKANSHVTDSLLFAEEGYEDEVNIGWERHPEGVVKETAYETVIRFSAHRHPIRLLIMGAPLPALSSYCPSYAAAKALHYLFDADILYIGEMKSMSFASPKFFRHVEEVGDDEERSFAKLVKERYDGKDGYFTSGAYAGYVETEPYLLRFVPCADDNCDCRDDTTIRNDVENFRT